jgi:hypothetical protein
MVIRDWQDTEGYAFTHSLSSVQWAWEFLRRNPLYQAEWSEFNALWNTLEAAYGRPPHRNFCAWKADPRAWVRVADCPDSDCRVDQDKVLIECAMGARWGFYKFPPSPQDDDPVGAQRLQWRPVEESTPIIGPSDKGWLGDDANRVALGFDLALPLRDQIERAKRTLQLMQRERQKSGQVRALSLRRLCASLCLMLQLLDAEEADADTSAIESVGPDWASLLEQAHGLRDGGYRRLAVLPP